MRRRKETFQKVVVVDEVINGEACRCCGDEVALTASPNYCGGRDGRASAISNTG